MGDRYLIINADDFGMCGSYNRAVFHLLEEKKITSTTLMPVTPGRDEAVDWCIRHKVRCAGLHTTMTSEWPTYRWSSMTGRKSLERADGTLYPTCEDFWRNARPEDVAAELDAQFAWFAGCGVFFSHADNHMGSLYPVAQGVPDYLPLVLERCARYQVPFRMFSRAYWNDGQFVPMDIAKEDIQLAHELKVPLLDTLYSYPFTSPDETTYEEFRSSVCSLLYTLPEGVSEIYFHPSVDSEEVRGITDTWQRRVWDYQLLMDDEFTYVLRDAGIQPVPYRESLAVRKL